MKMTDLTALMAEKRDTTGSALPLRVVICGEVNAGKSTVMNTLLRGHLLPDNIGRSERPLLVAGWREIPGIEASTRDGRTLRAALPGNPALFHEAESVRLWLDLPHLAGIELIELPMTKAEDLTGDQIDLVASADVLIWVTIGSQAWRLTEKAIVEALGAPRPGHSILVVSRGDKLRNDADRARLMERMTRETSTLFAHRLFLFGDRRRLAEAAVSDQAWTETGGAGLAAILHDLASANGERTRWSMPAREAETPPAAKAAPEITNDLPPVAEATETDDTPKTAPIREIVRSASRARNRAMAADAPEPEAVSAARVPDQPEAARDRPVLTATPAPDPVVDPRISDRAGPASEEPDGAAEDTVFDDQEASVGTIPAGDQLPAPPVATRSADAAAAPAEPQETMAGPVAPTASAAAVQTARPLPPGLLLAGLLPGGGNGDSETLAGADDAVAQLAAFCAGLSGALSGSRLVTDETGPVEGFSMSTGGRRLLFQTVPQTGTVFILVDAAVMPQGMAQMTLNQFCAMTRSRG